MLRGVAGESAVENEEHEDEEGEDAGENDEAEEGGEPGDRYAMSRSRTSGPPDEGGASVAHGRLIRLYARGVLNRWSFWRRWASSSSWCTALALLALGLPVVVVVGRGGSGSDDMLLFLVLAREDRRSKVEGRYGFQEGGAAACRTRRRGRRGRGIVVAAGLVVVIVVVVGDGAFEEIQGFGYGHVARGRVVQVPEEVLCLVVVEPRE